MSHKERLGDDLDAAQQRPILPLSVERTKAIIDHCLNSYFEKKLGEQAQRSPNDDRSYFNQNPSLAVRSADSGSKSSEEIRPPGSFDDFPEVLVDSSLSTPEEPPSASIRSFADFDHLTFSSQVNLSSSPLSDSARPPVHSGRISRKPVPPPPNRRPPALPGSSNQMRQGKPSRGPSNSHTFPRPGPATPENRLPPERYEQAKQIFKPLEDYLQQNYGRHDSINASFSTFRPRVTGRTHSESALRTPPPESMDKTQPSTSAQRNDEMFQIDAKMLLLGDFMENGDW
ncbi:Rho1 guanine nucleotide exchange factor 3 [Sphaceloma murrayae]|uniref:Rho1 guanine nucleotide exchange factor 3 n=1 Tax=Sphaceloma murrayae TaxID=2082308 RepID=A0A2K1QKD2_9PEZI|nr:Rho1 guanine nucleotide exchange factor 3 [Sphaceloma murrayae]